MTQIIPRTVNSHIAQNLEQAYSPLLARLLAARGVQSLDEAQLSMAHLLPPSTLKDIQPAAEFLAQCIREQRNIIVIADYDCDGATACAVAVRGLRLLGAQPHTVDFVVPNRFDYGYGLSPEIVQLAADLHKAQSNFPRPNVLLTVDNGMASVAGVELANQLGMEVIITDHHLPAEHTPPARAIVNPNQHGCTFASKHLAGVGVMFYVLIQIRAVLRAQGFYAHKTEPNLSTLLDLVALGTIADVVKLDANNRRLVAAGMARMRQGQACPGILALLRVAGRDYSRLATSDLGFTVGPRLNAAGRLDDMSLGIQCLLTDDVEIANELAAVLNDMNIERKHIEHKMREEAQVNLSALNIEAKNSICVYHPEFHQGVIGIVAGRIKEQYHRPTIVFADDSKEFLKGSGRSIAGIHLRDALDWVNKQAPEVIVKFGGHAMAAGLTIVREGLEQFTASFEQAILALSEPDVFIRQTYTDGVLSPQDITVDNIEQLNQYVWGQGFAAPLFEGQFEVIEQRLLKDTHSKLILRQNGVDYSAIKFSYAQDLPKHIYCTYQVQNNHWQGKVSIQLVIGVVKIV